MDSLPSGKKEKLDAANAIWFRDSEDPVVERDFLQANGALYSAGLYKALLTMGPAGRSTAGRASAPAA